MTREEIIKLAKALCTDFKCESNTMVDFCNSIIRELKQEPKTEKVIKMRDATPEERESVDKYVKSISKLTGVNFDTLVSEPSGDLISLETVIEWLKAKDIIKLSSQEETARKELKALLPVNPQEPSGDAISRVKHAIYKVCLSEGNKDIFVKILDEINKLSSVKQESCSNCCNGNQIEKAKLCQKSYLAGMEHKQEPKTGHWDRRACKCSECGYQITFSEYTEHKYKHCPNCGARMESEDKE
jgi:hypothetical protein